MRKCFVSMAVLMVFMTGVAGAQQAKSKAAPKTSAGNQARIRQAQSAAPADVSKGAMIMDWPDKEGGPLKMLKEGTNGWMCMPSSPSKGKSALQDPMCFDKAWQGWAEAYMTKKDPPPVTTMGVAYMLHGDKGASNIDPFATAPTQDNQWVISPSHVMILVPNAAQLDAFPAEAHAGGPWVMWKGTKYAHLMVPYSTIPTTAKAASKKK